MFRRLSGRVTPRWDCGNGFYSGGVRTAVQRNRRSNWRLAIAGVRRLGRVHWMRAAGSDAVNGPADGRGLVGDAGGCDERRVGVRLFGASEEGSGESRAVVEEVGGGLGEGGGVGPSRPVGIGFADGEGGAAHNLTDVGGACRPPRWSGRGRPSLRSSIPHAPP